MTASDKFKIVRRRYLIAHICSCLFLVLACQAYPTFTWQLEKLAQAPILATCVVQETSRDSSALKPGHRVVSAHATLRVLRSFPQLALREGEQIRLDFDALPEGDLGMTGPDVPNLTPGSVLVLPLKLNPSTSTDSWRLIANQGGGLVIPAALRTPPFAGQVTSRLDYVLREVASPLSDGTRTEVFAEASYLGRQDAAGYAAELMRLLESAVGVDQNRWALIAASLVGSQGVPRPTIADFYSGKHPEGVGVGSFSGPLLRLVLQRLGGSCGGQRETDQPTPGRFRYSKLGCWSHLTRVRPRPKTHSRTARNAALRPFTSVVSAESDRRLVAKQGLPYSCTGFLYRQFVRTKHMGHKHENSFG
jgi:hypothetical protein